MDSGHEITIDPSEPTTTIGLLGCDVTDLVRIGTAGAFLSMSTRRTETIEQRILDIEAKLQAVIDLVQP